MIRFKNRKLKRNKLSYCKKFRNYLKCKQNYTNLFVYVRYKLYNDVILPKYTALSKKIKRKGNIRKIL